MKEEISIVVTSDGSQTLYHPGVKQHYHSLHGAINESVHVFINSGLKYITKKEIAILEIGFGTGLNCFLTFIEKQKDDLSINYTTLEPFPLSWEIFSKLNYEGQLNWIKTKQQFLLLHQASFGKAEVIAENFVLEKLLQKVQEISFNQEFDLVYFDAFGPGAQPEMWSEEVFIKIFNAMKIGGILTTFCAKGEVKRTLKKVGFTVETLAGPPGKREMTRAIK